MSVHSRTAIAFYGHQQFHPTQQTNRASGIVKVGEDLVIDVIERDLNLVLKRYPCIEEPIELKNNTILTFQVGAEEEVTYQSQQVRGRIKVAEGVFEERIQTVRYPTNENTRFKGELLIHVSCNAPTSRLHFEGRAFDIFSRLEIPKLFVQRSSYNKVFVTNQALVLVHSKQQGKELQKSDITKELAKKGGEFLNKFINKSYLYGPANTDEFINDLNILNSPVFQPFSVQCSDDLYTELAKTPKGIITDFSLKNILVDENGKLQFKGFQTAYYGYVVMDIAIAAMDFALIEDNMWDIEALEEFLKPLSPWLKSNDISFNLFFELMKANCLRFALCEENPLKSPQMETFKSLDEGLKSKLAEIYNKIVV